MHAFTNLSALRRLQKVFWIMYKGGRKHCCFMVPPPSLNWPVIWGHFTFLRLLFTVLALVPIKWSQISLPYVLECTVLKAFLIYLLFGDVRYPCFSNTLKTIGSIPSLKINFNECRLNHKEQYQNGVLRLMNRPEQKHIHNWQETEGDK